MEIIMKDWIQPATSVKMGDTWRFYLWGSLVAQVVKNLPAVQETQVQSLGRKDPLVKEMDGNSLQCSHLENSVDRILYQVLTSQLQF